MSTARFDTKKLTRVALLAALTVVLQLLALVIPAIPTPFGPLVFNLSLLAIVIGALLFGPISGGILGLFSALTILISGQAAGFMAISAFGTIVVVIVKGVLSGVCAGLVARLLEKVNPIGSTIVAAAVCPVVNTGIYFIGCLIFFYDPATMSNAASFLFTLFGGINFIVELVSCIVLSAVIIRVLPVIGAKISGKHAGN